MRLRKAAIIPTLAVLSVTSCSDGAPDGNVAIYQNIVTFFGNGPVTANFTYQEIDDSPGVLLCVRGAIDTTRITSGTRLLMTYSLPDDCKYGEDCFDVILRGLQTVYTDTVTIAPTAEAKAANMPIYLSTFYRTGHYLNLYCSMPALPTRKYFLVADEATLDSDTVNAYLSTRVVEEKPAYNATQVVSIDINPIWKLPGITAVKVMVNNTNNTYRTSFTFAKTDFPTPISNILSQ